MPELDAITVLLINEQADESKLLTMSLRSSYPGCRVETTYSADEALERISKLDWHLIFLDEQLSHQNHLDLLQEVRRRAPRSAIIVEAAHQDSLRAMGNGADYYVFRHSVSFWADLPIVTKEVLEKRDLRSKLDLSQDRYRSLIDNLTETVYELDGEGRFVYISPAVKALVNYEPQELIGLPYTALLPPEELSKAYRRFNERRSCPRATRKLQLCFRGKGETNASIKVEINATALYNRRRQFLGTIGVLKRALEQRDQARVLERLANLAPPPTTIPANVEQWFHTVRDLQKELASRSVSPTPFVSPSTQKAAEGTTNQPQTERSQESLLFRERRRSSRIEIQVETCLRHNGANWAGTALNVSLGGMYMIFKGPVSAAVSQSIQLGFTSAVGILEVPGTVRGIRGPSTSPEQHHEASLTGLAIEFSGLKDPEGQILTSLLDGLRCRAITVKLVGLFLSQQDEEGRTQGRVSHHERVGQAAVSPAPIIDDGRASRRRRVSARVPLVVPIKVETTDAYLNLDRSDAYLTDLTAVGARLRLHAPPDLVGHCLKLHLAASATFTGQSTDAQSPKEYCVTGEVVWIVPATNTPTTVQCSLSATPLLFIGLRFIRFEGESERRIEEFVTHYLTSGDRIEERSEHDTLINEILDKHERRSLFDS